MVADAASHPHRVNAVTRTTAMVDECIATDAAPLLSFSEISQNLRLFIMSEALREANRPQRKRMVLESGFESLGVARSPWPLTFWQGQGGSTPS